MVRDQERSAGRGHVLEPLDGDPPPALVEPFDRRAPRSRRTRRRSPTRPRRSHRRAGARPPRATRRRRPARSRAAGPRRSRAARRRPRARDRRARPRARSCGHRLGDRGRRRTARCSRASCIAARSRPRRSADGDRRPGRSGRSARCRSVTCVPVTRRNAPVTGPQAGLGIGIGMRPSTRSIRVRETVPAPATFTGPSTRAAIAARIASTASSSCEHLHPRVEAEEDRHGAHAQEPRDRRVDRRRRSPAAGAASCGARPGAARGRTRRRGSRARRRRAASGSAGAVGPCAGLLGENAAARRLGAVDRRGAPDDQRAQVRAGGHDGGEQLQGPDHVDVVQLTRPDRPGSANWTTSLWTTVSAPVATTASATSGLRMSASTHSSPGDLRAPAAGCRSPRPVRRRWCAQGEPRAGRPTSSRRP